MGHLAAAAIASNLTSACFDKCPDKSADPLTHHNTSMCWEGCMDQFRELAPRELLLNSFGKGFRPPIQGGCPQLPPHRRLEDGLHNAHVAVLK